MSAILSTHKTSTTSHTNTIMKIMVAMIMSILLLAAVGCSTTQEFKPTASVIVGGHKSL